MNYLEAIILGIIQGFTEFLPISSSGHLEIVKTIFGNRANAQESLFLTLTLHVATALSTIVFFNLEPIIFKVLNFTVVILKFFYSSTVMKKATIKNS